MTNTASDTGFDVAIVGGGLVGASLAVALATSPLRLVLIEAASPPVAAPSWDERCIALNDGSVQIFTALGLWDSLQSQAEPIRSTHISERGRFGTARFEAADAGVEALGYNVPLRAIGAALSARMAEQANLRLLRPASVTALAIEATSAQLRIEIATAGSIESLSTRLVAAADGAGSAVRGFLGIDAQVRDYHQHAIVSAVRLSRPHHGVAYERFTPDGPIALIPKPDDSASLVWTVPSVRLQKLLALDDAAYLAQVQTVFGGRLGRFVEVGRRQSWPLARTLSKTLTAPRTVFIGNAAQSLHPVAAQGFNLGLRDVAQLARVLTAAGDPGDATRLAAYAELRRSDRERVSGLTDTMVRTFSNRVPGLSQLRHWGLVAVDLLPGLRDPMMRSHLGHRGLPREVGT
jgi:2-octaprenyl-6-methoxyphenol hydroxylase